MPKHLYRPGIALIGSWPPNCPEYPFRFEKPKINDKVWLIIQDEEEFFIEPDKIIGISDYYEQAKDRRENNLSISELLPPETYLIDFWLEKYNPGHGVAFGLEIFSSFDEAAFVLLQMYTEFYTDYQEALKEIQKWRKDYNIQGYFE